ncbi:MAG: hypothetical protein FWC50_01100 [Planctomycetaceae bacterium]|nr:hypothetical protein [Planctomycetaceae bacterium]
MQVNQQNNKNSNNRESDYSGPMFVIRWRWLLTTMLLIGLLGSGGYVLYKFRSKDQFVFLIEKAKQLEEAGKWRDAAEMLHRYQADQPDVIAVAQRLAEMYDEHGEMPSDWKNAANFYTLTLSITPENEKVAVLERILINQIKAQSMNDAFNTVEMILKQQPENPTAWKSLVTIRGMQINHGNYKPGQNEPAWFDLLVEKALQLNPDNVELTAMLASLLRSKTPDLVKSMSPQFQASDFTERSAKADRMMEQLVEKRPDDVKALLAHYEYRLRFGLLDMGSAEIDPELKKAFEIEPGNSAAMMYMNKFLERQTLLARISKNKEEYEKYQKETVEGYRKMIAAAPGVPLGYVQLAAFYENDGDQAKRIETLEQGNKATRSDDLNVIVSLIVAYLDAKEFKKADETIPLVYRWIERHRGMVSRPETIVQCQQMALMLEAQSLFFQDKAAEASAKFQSVFEPVIPRDIDDRLLFGSLMIYADLLTQMLNWDKAAEVYAATVNYYENETKGNVDPIAFDRLSRAYLGEIGAYEQIGQINKAVVTLDRYRDFLRQMIQLQPDNPSLRMSLVLAMYEQAVLKSPENVNWDIVLGELEKMEPMKERLPVPWRYDLLKAMLLWEKAKRSNEQLENILISLRAAESQYKGDLLFLVSLEQLYSNLGAKNDSQRVIDLIEKTPDGLPFWYAIKVFRESQQGNENESNRLLDEAVQKLPESQRQIFLTIKDTIGRERNATSRVVSEQELIDQLRKQASENPTMASLFQLILIELERGDLKAVASLEEQLRKMEGENGTLWLFAKAYRLVLGAKDANDPALNEARNLQKTILGKRPNWDMVYILESMIEDKTGNEAGVLAAEMKAIDMGNRNPQVFRDVIVLLLKAGRLKEAERFAAEAERRFPGLAGQMHFRFDPPYQNIYLDFSQAIRRNDTATAKRLADQWLKTAQEKNAKPDQIALFNSIIGRGFLGIKQNQFAEPYFTQAAKAGGEAVLPLAKFLAATGKMKEALQLIFDEMNKSDNNTLFLRSVIGLIRDYEYDKEWLRPFDEWNEKIDLKSIDDLNRLFAVAEYRVSRDLTSQAIPVYRRMLELQADNPALMNDLALLLAREPATDEATKTAYINEAIRLIDAALQESPVNPSILDTKGLIMLILDKPKEAVPLFQQAVQSSGNMYMYLLHLAVGQLRAGQTDAAKETFQAIRSAVVPLKDKFPQANREFVEELLKAFPEY